jgi:hypothetical protein
MAEPRTSSDPNRMAVIIALVLGAILAMGFLFRWPW